jgi:hypothetical protein
MNEPYLVFVVALLAATVLATLICASFERSTLQPKQRSFAKICRGLGFALAGVGILSVVSGMILTVGATAAPGLSGSDRTRIWSNGLAEACYNFVLTSVVAIPALLVARNDLPPP